MRFGLVAFPASGCNVTIMAVGLGTGPYYLIAQASAPSIVAISGFLVHQYWTFRDTDAIVASTEPQPIIVSVRPTYNGS